MPSMPSNTVDTTAPPVGASLRGWLDHLQQSRRLSVIEPGTDLRFQVAAIANRLDGRSASLFPAPAATTSR